MRRVFGHDVVETLDELLSPARAGLVMIDVQNDFCVGGGHYDRHGKDLSMMAETLPRIRELLAGARAAGIPVVHLQQTTLPDGKSDSPAWIYLKTRDGKSPDYTLEGTWGWEFVEGCGPAAGEVVVRKHRSSGFVHTTLETILHAAGIETVVIAGTTTQGCIESTAREAAHLDFYVAVIKDCVATTSRALHDASLTVQAVRHELVPLRQVLKIWSGARTPTAAAR